MPDLGADGPWSKVSDEASFRANIYALRHAMQRVESCLEDLEHARSMLAKAELHEALPLRVIAIYEKSALDANARTVRETLLSRTVRRLNLARSEAPKRLVCPRVVQSPHLWSWLRELNIVAIPAAQEDSVVYWRRRAFEQHAFVFADLCEVRDLLNQRKFVAFLHDRLERNRLRRASDLAALDESVRFEAAVAILLSHADANVVPAGLSEDLREQTDLWINFHQGTESWHRIQVSRSTDPSTTERKSQGPGRQHVAMVSPITLSRWFLLRAQAGVFDLGALFSDVAVASSDPRKLAPALANAMPRWAATRSCQNAEPSTPEQV
jgi:hypothetical protein